MRAHTSNNVKDLNNLELRDVTRKTPIVALWLHVYLPKVQIGYNK